MATPKHIYCVLKMQNYITISITVHRKCPTSWFLLHFWNRLMININAYHVKLCLQRQQEELRRLEEEREAEEKRRRQIESKQLYETNLRLKMKKKAREEQEQLAFDMKVLETLLQETANEAAEMAQRKVRLIKW